MYQDAIVLVILTMIEPKTADQKPATENPSSVAATSPNIAAFTTKRNSPRVRSVIGRVIRTATGRMTALTRPSKIAARMKVPVPLIETPETRADAMYRPSIVMSVLKIIPFIALIVRL